MDSNKETSKTANDNVVFYVLLYMKGLMMGAADVVPGVSGGTIAFISGIYERLLNTIKSINLGAVNVLFKEGVKAAWTRIDGTFLLVLVAGIFTSLVTLSKVIKWCMAAYPQLLWAFFFGLIIASTIYVAKQVPKWTPAAIASFLVGAIFAYGITILAPTESSTAYPMVFLAGSIAICAMILPGISGSFILLLMGMYGHVLGAAVNRDIAFLAVFALGCVTGLLLFSHILSWTFKNYYNSTMALLTGFMVGSLNKVWPWQNVVQTRTNSHGEEVPFLMENVLPANYVGEPYLLWACILFVVGFAVVLILEKVGEAMEKTTLK